MRKKYEKKYFKFKYFGLNHGNSSFKIGTDAVILGAWAGKNLVPEKVLDIGTGSGIIALMIAQRYKLARITGIEINSESAIISKNNFIESPFKDRLDLINIDVKDFEPNIKYDLIVSNPPFFYKSILPENETKLRSKHNVTVLIEDILHFASHHLNHNGLFSVIYPADQKEQIVNLAFENGLYLVSVLKVHPKEHADAHRLILEFSKTASESIIEDYLYIEKEERHDFHSSYKNLCKDFYLKF